MHLFFPLGKSKSHLLYSFDSSSVTVVDEHRSFSDFTHVPSVQTNSSFRVQALSGAPSHSPAALQFKLSSLYARISLYIISLVSCVHPSLLFENEMVSFAKSDYPDFGITNRLPSPVALVIVLPSSEVTATVSTLQSSVLRSESTSAALKVSLSAVVYEYLSLPCGSTATNYILNSGTPV